MPRARRVKQGMRALVRRRPVGRQGGRDRGRGCHQFNVLSGGDGLAERPAKMSWQNRRLRAQT